MSRESAWDSSSNVFLSTVIPTLGGLGFGDGKLTYGPERILEGYYTPHLWRGVFGSLDIQHITNPGYNRDRGPVLEPAARLRVDL